VPATGTLLDPFNRFLMAGYPAELQIGGGIGPNGPVVVLSVRCGPASLVVKLTRDEAKQWGQMIVDGAGRASPLIVPSGTVPINDVELPPMPPGEQP
jgi:hypothetical protein